MMVRRDAAGVRLLTRNGHDWTGRFPLIAEAARMLRARSFLIDGEAVACDGNGLPVFDRLRYRRQDGRVFLYAFDPARTQWTGHAARAAGDAQAHLGGGAAN
jgi:bifunctional non-homologous end joining protein LigD